MEVKEIEIRVLRPNNGEINGLPRNPRKISKKQLEKLKKSLADAPEMLRLRELICVEHPDGPVVIAGNQRLEAAKALGWETLPCKVLPADTDPAKLREYAIKDNLPFGEDDWEVIASDWDTAELEEWGMAVPEEWESFEDKMRRADEMEEDDEYRDFVDKFKAAKTTDDCYTPVEVYEAVASWVADQYGVERRKFVRPFYPGGDYKRYTYPEGCVVVDNPPFSILSEILQHYNENSVRFFLFAPTLTLFSSSSSSSTALPAGVSVVYENGASVNTSFLTNLEDKSVRVKSVPSLYRVVQRAADEFAKSLHKELPKYSYPDNIVTSSFVARLSKYGIDFSFSVGESEPIGAMDAQKEVGKAIYGKGYIIAEKAAAEKAAAEKAAAEKGAAEKAAAEKAAAEKAAAQRWQLSEREKQIIQKLNNYAKE